MRRKKPLRFTVVFKGGSETRVDTVRLSKWIESDLQLGRAIRLRVGESLQANGPDGAKIGVVRES